MTGWVMGLFIAASGPEVLAQVQAKVSVGGALKAGRFSQSRQVQGLKRPVVSSGRFVVQRGVSLEWVTESPVRVALTVEKGQVVLTQGSSTPRRFDAKRDPAAASASRLLFALLAGEAAGVLQMFEVEGDVSEASWRITLTPKKNVASQLPFVRLTATGAADVQQTVLVERSGDSTTVTLSDIKAL
jgi:outer membrane lipoprotein-sorting protein